VVAAAAMRRRGWGRAAAVVKRAALQYAGRVRFSITTIDGPGPA
jgi:hypothetical protein